MTKLLFAVTSYFHDLQRGCHQAIRNGGWGQDVAAIGADLRFFIPYMYAPEGSSVPFMCTPEGSFGGHYYDFIPLANPYQGEHYPGENSISYYPGKSFATACIRPAYAASLMAHPTEIFLDAESRYNHISILVQRILRWSLCEGYDFTYVVANDTFVVPRLVFSPGYELFDYSGVSDQPELPFGQTVDWYWYKEKIPNLYGWFGGGTGIMFSRKAARLIVVENLRRHWISKYDFWGFGYDSLFGQILGPHIKSGSIRARNYEGASWHYQHSEGEQRYVGVCEWQREMQEKQNQ